NGERLTEGRTGYADPELRTPIPDGAIYRIYSMTKPLVSVLALQLIERGRLRLYDPIASFDRRFARPRVLLPNGQLLPANRPITVEDLLTHRAGFTYEFISGCHLAPAYQKKRISSDGLCSLDEMMSLLAELPLASQPGSQVSYNVPNDVLAHVLERAADRPLDELLEEQLLRPLGMEDTAFYVPNEKRSRLMPIFGVTDLSELAPLEPRPHELTPADVDAMYPCDKPDFR